MKRLVLASQSAVRARLLEAAGVLFDIEPADIDENAIRHSLVAAGTEHSTIAKVLAEHKALAVSARHNDVRVIGADQLLIFQGQILGKVESLADAEATLRRLRGQPHQLISAVVLAINGAAVWAQIDSATLQMRQFSDAFLADYLFEEGDAVLTSVGCYRLEGAGAQLFSHIEGDYFTVLGLPLLPLLAALRDQGLLRI